MTRGRCCATCFGGWQISGLHVHPDGHAVLRSRAPTTSRAWATAATGSRSTWWAIRTPAPTASSRTARTRNFFFNPAAFANPSAGTFGNSTRNILRNPGDQQWDIALFKNITLPERQKIQLRAEVFNFLEPPEPERGPISDITNPNFGRVITKDGSRRDIQLAVRYLF